jgi:hexosaminidase
LRTIFVLSALLALVCPMFPQQGSPLHLMPWPSSVQASPETPPLNIDTSFAVSVRNASDPHLQKTVEIFLNDLRRHTGMHALDFRIAASSEPAQLEVQSGRASKLPPELGEDESYKLTVTSSQALLSAPTTLGVMRGLQTFLQLAEVTPHGFAVPAVVINDKPRFPWRGLMIDSSRHFMPLKVIKRNLDGMAAVKLNVLHWHLSDDQGFRIESKHFPRLQEMGSDGLYYTQDQVRDIIAYAADRGIRVVPEFDMPGHSLSWFVGYPDLASGPGPFSVGRRWGIFNPAMDPTRNSTYKFLDKFIGEMAKLFPDRFFHIGGDEVNGKQWDANPKIQAFKEKYGLKSNEDLQAYFNTRIQKIVSKHHKIMEGWDEILRPDLPKDIVIQSWRGQKSLADAAKQGYRGILSSGYYLDLMSPASAHYAVDPLSGAAADLSDAQKQNILGGEACMWAEYVSPENVDSRIWPRMAAIAERLWSPQSVTDVNSMYQRLAIIGKWLDAYGLTHDSRYDVMLQRMAGLRDATALRTLIDLVEPVKGYSRYQLASVEPTSITPLNRPVDAARPESIPAREFAALVDSFVAGQLRPGLEAQIRGSLVAWRDNDLRLRPLTEKSSFVSEVEPLSQNLSTISVIGLQALAYLDRAEKPPAGWAAQQSVVIQQAFQPKAQLLLMVAPSIQKLVQISNGEKASDLPIPKRAAQ